VNLEPKTLRVQERSAINCRFEWENWFNDKINQTPIQSKAEGLEVLSF
jgi:hypothetical protein